MNLPLIATHGLPSLTQQRLWTAMETPDQRLDLTQLARRRAAQRFSLAHAPSTGGYLLREQFDTGGLYHWGAP